MENANWKSHFDLDYTRTIHALLKDCPLSFLAGMGDPNRQIIYATCLCLAPVTKLFGRASMLFIEKCAIFFE